MPVNIPHRPPRKYSKNPNYHKQRLIDTGNRPVPISIPKVQELRQQPAARLTPSAALLSISTTLPTFERQVLKEMLIDERLGKGRSIYEFKEEEKHEYDHQQSRKYGVGPRTISPTSILENENNNSNIVSATTSLGFTLCDALRFFSQTGDHDTLKTQLYLLAVQRGMDVGSSLWISIFAPFGTNMCNKVSLVARRERIKNYHGIDMDGLDKEMAYGASNFFAFNSILERCDIQQNDEFLDLGSGCGRAVLAASILHGHLLKSSYGIEILEPLHHVAVGCEKRFQMLRNSDPHERYDFGSTEIGFIIGDVRYSKWPNQANIVFVGSATYGTKTMKLIEERIIENLPIGGKVITLTRQLFQQEDEQQKKDLLFKEIDSVLVKMTWGHSRCFIYKRLK